MRYCAAIGNLAVKTWYNFLHWGYKCGYLLPQQIPPHICLSFLLVDLVGAKFSLPVPFWHSQGVQC